MEINTHNDCLCFFLEGFLPPSSSTSLLLLRWLRVEPRFIMFGCFFNMSIENMSIENSINGHSEHYFTNAAATQLAQRSNQPKLRHDVPCYSQGCFSSEPLRWSGLRCDVRQIFCSLLFIKMFLNLNCHLTIWVSELPPAGEWIEWPAQEPIMVHDDPATDYLWKDYNVPGHFILSLCFFVNSYNECILRTWTECLNCQTCSLKGFW